MNLSSMRSVDHNDPIGGLGPRKERAPTPAPAPVVRPDGIVVHPDGKLSTELPLPEGHPDATPTHIGGVPVWPFPSKPAEPETGACLREPLRVGDRVRWLGNGTTNTVSAVRGGYFDVTTPGGLTFAGYAVAEDGKTWERA